MEINPLFDALESTQAITGFIGAILVLAASHFKDIGLKMNKKKWYYKVLFLFCGYLAGILIHAQYGDVKPFYCASIGGGWIYLASGLLSTASVLTKAENMKRIGKVVMKEIMEMNNEGDQLVPDNPAS